MIHHIPWKNDDGTAWSLNQSIHEKHAQFAANGKTLYTTDQIIQMVYYSMLTTGLYSDKIKAYRQKTAGEKTWKNFKKNFSVAYHDMCGKQRLTTGMAKFHKTNATINIGTGM